MAFLAAFAVAAQAGDTKAVTKDGAQKEGGCCAKPATEQTSLEVPKAEAKAESSCCGCCSKMAARKSAAVKPLFSPKGAELARR